METNAREIVLSFLIALNSENFDTAKSLLSNDMKFEGVIGSRDGNDNYINDMKKMKFKYNILKVFEDENDVCVFYNIDMNGKKIFTCGWYTLSDRKIKSLRVIFDPRPVLQ